MSLAHNRPAAGIDRDLHELRATLDRSRAVGSRTALSGLVSVLVFTGCVPVEFTTVGVDRRIGTSTSVEVVGPIADYPARCTEDRLAIEPSTPGSLDRRCSEPGTR